MKASSLALIVWVLMIAHGCVPPGQRLLTVQVEQDGSVLFEGIRGVPDSTPVEDMWDVLDEVSFKALDGEGTPAEISGELVVRIKHVDHELASVTVQSLTLQPRTDSSGFSISNDELERIKQAM